MAHKDSFGYGAHVEKFAGDYTGPGVIRGSIENGSGDKRYIVAHRIEGGTGEFLHIYSPGQLRLKEPTR